MHIEIKNLEKKYNNHWIFRGLNFTLSPDNVYVIQGPNGSGKSTLLQCISQIISPTSGQIIYSDLHYALHTQLSFCAPYMELIEEMTISELMQFHFKLRSANIRNINNLWQESGLIHHQNKAIKKLSSGYKQRVKLALSIYTDSKLLALDEPCSNLDRQGIEWYISRHDIICKDRIVVIASNTAHEYEHYKYIPLELNSK